jgi:hypothetical protein
VDATTPVGKWQWGTNNNSCTHAKDIGVGCDMWTSAADSGNPLVPDNLKVPYTSSVGTKGNA